MRRILSTAAAGIAVVAVLVGPTPVVATAAGSPRAAVAVAPRAASPLTTMAPAVPGARRFTGTISSDVRQLIVVSASSWRSTTGVVRLYVRSGSHWKQIAKWAARLGYGGLVRGTHRVQGTGTTPAGSYTITTAFGIRSDPGTALPYTRVDDDQWWVEDRTSAYYNQMRRASLGGFHVTTAGYNGSEHLARMGSQYDHVAVIDFNRRHPVIGRDAGIFLHAFGRGATAGCVAVSYAHMTSALKWLNPAQHPMILIGPSSWLNA